MLQSVPSTNTNRLVLLATVIVLAAASIGRSETAVSPSALENTEGDTKSNSWPAASRAMTTYGSSTFESIPDGPVRISSLSWRPNGDVPAGAVFGFDNLKLLLYVTPVAPANMSQNFATNIANAITEPVVVLDQAWDAVAGVAPPGNQTRPFEFTIPLTTPFEFDPDDGNLLIDWFFGSPISGQSSFDRSFSTFIDHRTTWSGDPNQAGGNGFFSVPTQFEFEAVPEPTCGLNASLISLGLLSRQRRRRI